ncbi:MAG: recombinase family protein [Campylobacteraceae bacterium]|jgi:DNA invertase Pin-like site-specific DNA recombinase|nr:recombinase family protein [Campylobacteraceae bacterium]MBT6388776.1 recombinase family protein [Campylobacteraceae bacterium]MBT6577288.1 recombinase family protein [Campylobacteraceae bacterium]MBT7117820.1 recombinase family protein [Campylobacteraceae bacterium]
MSTTIAFIRVNKNNSEYALNQVEVIKSYLLNNNIDLTKSIKAEVNRPDEEENILNLLDVCTSNCTLIISDLHILARTTERILEILNILLDRGTKIISINQNYELSKSDTLTKMVLAIISHTLTLEKDLMSLRTKEALIAKKLDGIHLGKPKGTIQKSKFDEKKEKIIELLGLGLSVRKIAKLLGYNNHIGLNNYIKKRGIKENLEL